MFVSPLIRTGWYPLFIAILDLTISAHALLDTGNWFGLPASELLPKVNLSNFASEASDHSSLLVNTEYGQLRGRLNLTPIERFGWILNSNKNPAKYPRIFAG
jgi:hypothetical protein